MTIKKGSLTILLISLLPLGANAKEIDHITPEFMSERVSKNHAVIWSQAATSWPDGRQTLLTTFRRLGTHLRGVYRCTEYFRCSNAA